MPEQQDYISSLLSDFNTKIGSMEEKQKLLKERVLLIGRNLIESREEQGEDIEELKSDIEIIKNDLEKIKRTLIRFGEELDKRARHSQLNRIEKQIKMFDPYLKK